MHARIDLLPHARQSRLCPACPCPSVCHGKSSFLLLFSSPLCSALRRERERESPASDTHTHIHIYTGCRHLLQLLQLSTLSSRLSQLQLRAEDSPRRATCSASNLAATSLEPRSILPVPIEVSDRLVLDCRDLPYLALSLSLYLSHSLSLLPFSLPPSLGVRITL